MAASREFRMPSTRALNQEETPEPSGHELVIVVLIVIAISIRFLRAKIHKKVLEISDHLSLALSPIRWRRGDDRWRFQVSLARITSGNLSANTGAVAKWVPVVRSPRQRHSPKNVAETESVSYAGRHGLVTSPILEDL